VLGRPSKYPSEFRREAVELVRTSGRPRVEIARSLGISDNTLANWVTADRERRERDRDPEALTESERVELRRLRRENTQLQMDLEILRKAAAYFAQETIRSAASGSSTSTEAPTASSGSVESFESRVQGSTPGRPGRRRRERPETES
jgi:transposase